MDDFLFFFFFFFSFSDSSSELDEDEDDDEEEDDDDDDDDDEDELDDDDSLTVLSFLLGISPDSFSFIVRFNFAVLESRCRYFRSPLHS